MSYLVLARKWRPQTFADLVGQDHVSRTLANAIAQNRVAHAFLFTGVRGVGKTTSARIMAKALNCEKGPTASPCLACGPCREIAAGSDVDVQEIDAASYNGVDEVRKLQETLPYRPARDRHKIFIVDEVHMLSQSAWNAFLKTLEEPPPHVKFLFATTEVHKVPVTILSRCQRYDFKLIPSSLIAERLRFVLGQEQIRADEASIALIAREAAGSLRDAMSLLDQTIAWSGDALVGEEVARVLGVAGRDVLHRIGRALLTGDAASCVELVANLAEQGFDVVHVARDMLAYLRDLVVAKVCGSGQLLEGPADETRALLDLAGPADADDLIRLQHGFSGAYDEIARAGQPRAALEMALVRLARRPPLAPLDDLVDRLAELEKRLQPGGGSPPPTRGPAGPPPPSGPRGGRGPAHPNAQDHGPSRASAAAGQLAGRSAVRVDRAHASGPSPADEAPEGLEAAPASDNSDPLEDVPEAFVDAVPEETGTPTRRSLPPAVPFASPWTPPLRPMRPAPEYPALGSANATSALTPTAPVASARPPTAPPALASPAPSALTPTPPVAAGPRPPGPAPDIEAWRRVLEGIRRTDRPLAAVLELASPIAFGPERVVLGYEPRSFLALQANEPSRFEHLTRAVRAHYGVDTAVEIDQSSTALAPSVAKIDEEQHRLRLEAARKAAAEHPLVRAAKEILGAELRELRVAES